MYTQCRRQEMVRIEKQKGTGKSAHTEISLLPKSTGYSVLPWEGGMADQPYRMMVFFDAFQAGESEAFSQRVNK